MEKFSTLNPLARPVRTVLVCLLSPLFGHVFFTPAQNVKELRTIDQRQSSSAERSLTETLGNCSRPYAC